MAFHECNVYSVERAFEYYRRAYVMAIFNGMALASKGPSLINEIEMYK